MLGFSTGSVLLRYKVSGNPLPLAETISLPEGTNNVETSTAEVRRPTDRSIRRETTEGYIYTHEDKRNSHTQKAYHRGLNEGQESIPTTIEEERDVTV